MQNRLFKVLSIVLVAMLALSFSLGAQAKKPPMVGISTGSSGTSWRTIMIDALEMVGKEYKAAGKIKDYKLVNNVTNGDATEQANILRDFISQGVDIILVNPNSPDALNGVIKEAQDEGILVVSYDATVTAPGVLNVTLDHYAWMTKNMEWNRICQLPGLRWVAVWFPALLPGRLALTQDTVGKAEQLLLAVDRASSRNLLMVKLSG